MENSFKNVLRVFSSDKTNHQYIVAFTLLSNAAIELWSQIQAEHPELIPVFEEFIHSLAMKHQQIREETAILEQCFNK